MQDLATGGQSADAHCRTICSASMRWRTSVSPTSALWPAIRRARRTFAPMPKSSKRSHGFVGLLQSPELLNRRLAGAQIPRQIHQRMQARLNDIDLDGPWPLPLPLVTEAMGVPYPLDALPAGLANAVREVAGFVQCPVALAACSAFSALSVAGQGLVNVCRGDSLIGPVGTTCWRLRNRGKEKSECDRRFSDGLHA